ncbi:inorganic diphosphatase [Candidatus Woesearchaeota archaeon]|nr:inorganic diphosphatase [Candidatus Woesearchaeota archaeon]
MHYSQQYLGKTVTVKIDRALGSKHPKYGFIYPINYGFIEGTKAPDGSEVDAYVLGIFEPVESFNGKCIAIIHRTNDEDDKLVVVPNGKKYSEKQIRALTEFQERFFKSRIIKLKTPQ